MIQVNVYLNHSDSYIAIPQADVDFTITRVTLR
nr:MAG TPA: hypothetical protein [Caudoviricetes sp.]